MNGKVFAQIYPYLEDYKITLKWNTIYLADFPDDELLNMIDQAYETVLHSFSKKVQKQILEEV